MVRDGGAVVGVGWDGWDGVVARVARVVRVAGAVHVAHVVPCVRGRARTGSGDGAGAVGSRRLASTSRTTWSDDLSERKTRQLLGRCCNGRQDTRAIETRPPSVNNALLT